jgi:N-acetylmuramic acid 6-phosphate etherase
MKFLGIDIGGTWIKGTIVDEQFIFSDKRLKFNDFKIEKIKNPFHTGTTPDEVVEVLKKLMASCQGKPGELNGIGISTTGIINYHGTRVLKISEQLSVLKSYAWKDELEKYAQCNVVLINDADAATIGLAETGGLRGNKVIGIMPVGTGLGFSVWRNGRRWCPGKSPTLLGSIRIPDGNFDSFVSVSKLAALDENNSLANVLTDSFFKREREAYIQRLVRIINNAAILYSLDEVVICGGLADAVVACNYQLEEILNKYLLDIPAELDIPVKVIVAKEGNKLQLIGALALAKGESIAVQNRILPVYETLDSEIPYREDMQLQAMQSLEVVETLWQAEQEAGDSLKYSLPLIAKIADESLRRVKEGGRIIYVGAGSSGRIATMDSVEVPCFGFPEDRIFAIVSGGISDAAIEIESDFEEDASAVPEILLTNITPKDVVIGISASGFSYYVQSALALAKSRGALSVMIQNKLPEMDLPFCDFIIPLNSGHEVIAGSTRMKAGTATKKVLNFLSSTLMINMGKVEGSYLVDVAIINNKLLERALGILKTLYNVNKKEALQLLKNNNMQLGLVIQSIRSTLKK